MRAHLSRIAVLAAAAGVLLGTNHGTVGAQTAPPSDVYGQIDDDADEVRISSSSSDESTSGSERDRQVPDVVTQTALAPACEGNHPDNGGSAYSLCVGAQTVCPQSAAGNPQILMWRWNREWDTVRDVALTEWEMQSPICLGWDEVEVPSIPMLVLREFEERAQLLRATVRIQPSGGRTLVNFDTIFYVEDPSTTYDGIIIAGSSVDLEITADTYTWYFGDGMTTTTAEPGRPYPNKDITHRYRETQTINPRVDVTYTGRYRVDGGAWLDIPGTAMVSGPEVPLTVVSARSELIAGS